MLFNSPPPSSEEKPPAVSPKASTSTATEESKPSGRVCSPPPAPTLPLARNYALLGPGVE